MYQESLITFPEVFSFLQRQVKKGKPENSHEAMLEGICAARVLTGQFKGIPIPIGEALGRLGFI